MLSMSIAVSAIAASTAAAAGFGPPIDLTSTGGASGTPRVAIGSEGRTVVTWVERGALVARLGGPARLGAVQVLGRAAGEIGPGATDLVAAVGAGGVAAVAWIAAGGPHNARMLVSVAPAGRPFGRARWINGGEVASGVDGVGVDGRGHVLVTWRGFDPKCCEMAPVRYAIGSAGHRFTPARTLPVRHEAGGYGQVIETTTGGLIATAASDPTLFFELDPSGRKLTSLPAPRLDASTAVVDVAAGPNGIGASVYSDDVMQGLYFGADVGATLLPSYGVWSQPTFASLPPSTPTLGPGYSPVLALPANGSTVLGLTIGRHVELDVAPSGGVFGAPQVIGQATEFGPDALNPSDPQIVAFGSNAALAWLDQEGHRLTINVATYPPTGHPVKQALGPIDQLTAESLATNGRTAAIAWVSRHHLRLAFAPPR